MPDQQQHVTALKWLYLSVVIVFLDLVTKYIASHYLQYSAITVLPGFNLTLMHNYGAAFSFLSDAGGWQRWFFIMLTIAVSIFILLWLYQLAGDRRCLCCALALVLGGALGNLWDRITLGYVVDFIDISLSFLPWRIFNPWPAFNIADSAITIGVILLISDELFFNDQQSS